jgi:isopenicillin N synthase-like dioxygenase
MTDYLKSTLHRVHLPMREESYSGEGEARMTKARFSIPYFVIPKMEMALKPLEGYSSEGEKNGYEPIAYEELYSRRVDGVFVNRNLDT